MKTAIYTLFSLLISIACGSEANSKANTLASEASTKVEKSCLAQKAEIPCSLLSIDEISSLSGAPVADIEMEEPHEVIKTANYMFCSFTWPSDRMKKIEMLSLSTEVPVDNTIQLGGVLVLNDKVLNKYGQEKTRVEYFEDYYTNSTDEENKKAKEMMDKGVEENEDLSSSEKDLASKILDMASKFSFSPVSGVGEMASWEVTQNQSGGSLIILHGNVIFKIMVNISDENEPNLSMAKKLAETILDQC